MSNNVPKQAVESLTRVAEWLEAGAPHRRSDGRVVHGFNMSHGVGTEDCGTTCCIAGAVCQFEGLGVLSYDGEMNFFGDTDGAGTLAAKHMGLSDEVASRLFMPFDHWVTEGAGVSVSDPEAAAKVVRHYLATGQVDWSVGVPGLEPRDAGDGAWTPGE